MARWMTGGGKPHRNRDGGIRDGGIKVWSFRKIREGVARGMPGLFVSVVLLFFPVTLFAAPPAEKTCGQMRAERNALVKAGVKDKMAKGPEWVLANVTGDDLQGLKRYIVLVERIKFRCNGLQISKLATSPAARKRSPAKASPKTRKTKNRGTVRKKRKKLAARTRPQVKKKVQKPQARKKIRKKRAVKKLARKNKKKKTAPDLHAEVFN